MPSLPGQAIRSLHQKMGAQTALRWHINLANNSRQHIREKARAAYQSKAAQIDARCRVYLQSRARYLGIPVEFDPKQLAMPSGFCEVPLCPQIAHSMRAVHIYAALRQGETQMQSRHWA